MNICPFKIDHYSSQLRSTNFYWVLLERKTPWWGARPRPCPLGLKSSFVQSRMLKGAQGWVEYLLYPAQGNRKTKLVVDARTGHRHPISCRTLIIYPVFFLCSLTWPPGQSLRFTYWLFIYEASIMWEVLFGVLGIHRWTRETMLLPSGSLRFCERRHAENKYMQC